MPRSCWRPPAADTAHPAFSKLFVETEFVAERRRAAGHAAAAVARRSARSGRPTSPSSTATASASTEFETDRARFLGRGRDVRAPLAVIDGRPLSNTVGAVLDPVFSLRRRFALRAGSDGARRVLDARRVLARRACSTWSTSITTPPRSSAPPPSPGPRRRCSCTTSASTGRGAPVPAPGRARALRRPRAAPAVRVHSRGSGRAAGSVAAGHLRRPADRRWCGFDDDQRISLVRQLLRVRILADEAAGGRSGDPERARRLVRAGSSDRAGDAGAGQPVAAQSASTTRGHVFLLRADLISAETAALPQIRRARRPVSERAAASPISSSALPSQAPLASARRKRAVARSKRRCRVRRRVWSSSTGSAASPKGGREYVTILGPGQSTPAPWINVVANPGFGFQVSAEGGGFTWAVNSQQHQLTPWSNDPVSDRPGEASMCATKRPGSCGARLRCRSARRQRPMWRGMARLQPLRARVARHRARAARVCAARRSDQDLAAENAQPFGALATTVGHGVRRVGARPSRRGGARRSW